MVKMLESKAVEIVEDSEPELKVDDKPRLEVVVELASKREEISQRPTKVVELHIEKHVYLLAEPTLELIPSLTVMRVLLFLRLSDLYDPLQIFLQKAGSQENSALICGSVFSGAG